MNNWTLIKVLGGLYVLTTGLIAWIGSILLARFQARWKGRFDKELEVLKGQINQTSSTLSNLTTSYLNNFNKVQEKRIEASESLWNSVLALRAGIPPPISLAFQILLDEEINIETIRKTKKLSHLYDLNEPPARLALLHPLKRTGEMGDG